MAGGLSYNKGHTDQRKTGTCGSYGPEIQLLANYQKAENHWLGSSSLNHPHVITLAQRTNFLTSQQNQALRWTTISHCKTQTGPRFPIAPPPIHKRKPANLFNQSSELFLFSFSNHLQHTYRAGGCTADAICSSTTATHPLLPTRQDQNLALHAACAGESHVLQETEENNQDKEGMAIASVGRMLSEPCLKSIHCGRMSFTVLWIALSSCSPPNLLTHHQL